MNMKTHYRKIAMKSANVAAIICAVIIAILVALTGSGIAGVVMGPKKLKADTDLDLKEYVGKYVEIDVTNVMSEYLRITTTTKNKSGATISSKLSYIGYLICVTDKDYYFDEDTYFGIVLPAKDEKTMDSRMEDFWNYMAYEVDKAPKSFTVKGSVREMKDSELKYYKQTIKDIDKEIDGGWGFETAQFYTIDTRDIGKVKSSVAWLSLIGVVVSALVGILYYMYAVMTYDKNYKKFLAEHPFYTDEQIESEFARAERMNKDIFVNDRFVFYHMGCRFNVVDLNQCIWAYFYKRTGKNSVFEMRYYTAERKLIRVPASESLSHTILEKVNATQPHMVVGYSKELEQMFNRNLNEFLNLRYYPAKNAAQAAYTQAPTEDPMNPGDGIY